MSAQRPMPTPSEPGPPEPVADAARGRDVALCRSILYQALALAFRRPAVHILDSLGTQDALEALVEAATVLDEDRAGAAPDRHEGLAGRVRALAGAAGTLRLEALTLSHLALFGHTVRGPVPPYETEYGEDTLFQKPQEMSDIAGFLAAFGLALDASKHERIDHLSCELEFVAFLARKEAHALECGNIGMQEETGRATRLFLEDHLARFVPSFARRVVAADPDGFYGRVAQICLDFVGAECRRYGVPAGPEMLRLRMPIDDAAPIACGVPDPCGLPGPCGPSGESGCAPGAGAHGAD